MNCILIVWYEDQSCCSGTLFKSNGYNTPWFKESSVRWFVASYCRKEISPILMAKKCKMVNPVYIESPRDWQTYVFSTCYFRPPCLFPNKVMRRPINTFRHGVWKPVEENSDDMNIVMRRVYFKREAGKWRQKPWEEWTPKRKSLDVSRLSRLFSKCVSNDEFELWIEPTRARNS